MLQILSLISSTSQQINRYAQTLNNYGIMSKYFYEIKRYYLTY